MLASLPVQSRTFVASVAVSRYFVLQSEFTLVGRGGIYRGFWRVLPNDCCADRVFHKAASATSHAFNVIDHAYVNSLVVHMLFALRVFRLVG